ncbi:MAG: OmpA family protein, partial [Bacteroidota bacterium]
SDQEEYTEVEKDFYLIPLEKGATLRLNYIYFGRGSAALLPDSYPELNKLVEMMDENPKVEIRLEGHTEIYGNKKSLTKLSESRVLSVKNYLVSQGIDQKRIKYKGYGPIRPITVKGSEKERQLNRRVEVKIL